MVRMDSRSRTRLKARSNWFGHGVQMAVLERLSTRDRTAEAEATGVAVAAEERGEIAPIGKRGLLKCDKTGCEAQKKQRDHSRSAYEGWKFKPTPMRIGGVTACVQQK